MRKSLSEKSLEVLIDKAADCAELAKAQRADADKQQAGVDRQHESAHKLEKLSEALAEDAADIQSELELDKKTQP